MYSEKSVKLFEDSELTKLFNSTLQLGVTHFTTNTQDHQSGTINNRKLHTQQDLRKDHEVIHDTIPNHLIPSGQDKQNFPFSTTRARSRVVDCGQTSRRKRPKQVISQ